MNNGLLTALYLMALLLPIGVCDFNKIGYPKHPAQPL